MYTDSVITDCPELAGYWDRSLMPFLTGQTYQKLKVQKLKVAWFTLLRDWNVKRKEAGKVPPRFELGSLDSESRVLTITPWNRHAHGSAFGSLILREPRPHPQTDHQRQC